MKLVRGLTTLAVVTTLSLSLSACGFKSKSEVGALNEAQSVGSPFTQQLTTEYRNMANDLQNNKMDYADALHFARKGLASASGEVVLPEPISDWNLKPNHIEELAPARAGLIAALDKGGREQQPQIAAVAQARFDCWIERQEANWNATNIPCKNEFFDALNKLGGTPAVPPETIMPPISAAAPPSTPLPVEDAKYLVFFDFDKSNVDAGGQSVVDSIATEAKKQNLSSVNIVGHADKSGSDSYNKRLGMRRANAVREALQARGIEARMLNVSTMGEAEPMVDTPDGVREPANRRAEITFSK